LTRINEDYVGITREDDTDMVTVGFNYELQRWLAVNFGYTYSDKDSNTPNESETKNLFMLTFQGSL